MLTFFSVFTMSRMLVYKGWTWYNYYMQDEIYSYREMCDLENVQTLQRGMNFSLNSNYSVILMSQRSNAPYKDRILEDGVTIEYEGHDQPKTSPDHNPKTIDQPLATQNGTLTQNGKFVKAVEDYKRFGQKPELVKAYEKILLVFGLLRDTLIWLITRKSTMGIETFLFLS